MLELWYVVSVPIVRLNSTKAFEEAVFHVSVALFLSLCMLRYAAAPTTMFFFLLKNTHDGIVSSVTSIFCITGFPLTIRHILELVVPRSMPNSILFCPIIIPFYKF